jgi:hypothetical protein
MTVIRRKPSLHALARPRQFFCLVESCHARGNCDTFCPEDLT